MTTSQPIDAGIEERFADQQARLAAMSFPHALAVGDRAADFELPNAYGRRIRLAYELERGAVVLIFYRGAWCPFSATCSSAASSRPYRKSRHLGPRWLQSHLSCRTARVP